MGINLIPLGINLSPLIQLGIPLWISLIDLIPLGINLIPLGIDLILHIDMILTVSIETVQIETNKIKVKE